MKLTELPLYNGCVVSDGRFRLGKVFIIEGEGQRVDMMDLSKSTVSRVDINDVDGENWVILEAIEPDPYVKQTVDKNLADLTALARHMCPVDYTKLRAMCNELYRAGLQLGGKDLLLATFCSVCCDLVLCEYIKSGYATVVNGAEPSVHFTKLHLITCTKEHS